jgi:hypothetical protein
MTGPEAGVDGAFSSSNARTSRARLAASDSPKGTSSTVKLEGVRPRFLLTVTRSESLGRRHCARVHHP